MRKLGVVLMSGLFVMAIAGLAHTAEGDPPPLEFSKTATLSGAEQLAQGGIFLDKMKEALARVNTLAEEARKDKDVIRLNCVNEKLIGIRGMLSIAEASYTALKDAVSRDDADERTHEFTKLQIAYTKAMELKAEAESCAGEVTIYFGDTVLDTTVDPEVPEEDPTTITPPDLGGLIDRPTETSPAT
jgi:hypothetical protein